MPVEIFCCYARKDQELLAQLKNHLALLGHLGQIRIWSDADIDAGMEWERELQRHLESADIILPTTDGREIRLRRITEPTAEQKALLQQLDLTLPECFDLTLKCSVDSSTA